VSLPALQSLCLHIPSNNANFTSPTTATCGHPRALVHGNTPTFHLPTSNEHYLHGIPLCRCFFSISQIGFMLYIIRDVLILHWGRASKEGEKSSIAEKCTLTLNPTSS
jgi:hypothetical protein